MLGITENTRILATTLVYVVMYLLLKLMLPQRRKLIPLMTLSLHYSKFRMTKLTFLSAVIATNQ